VIDSSSNPQGANFVPAIVRRDYSASQNWRQSGSVRETQGSVSALAKKFVALDALLANRESILGAVQNATSEEVVLSLTATVANLVLLNETVSGVLSYSKTTEDNAVKVKTASMHTKLHIAYSLLVATNGVWHDFEVEHGVEIRSTKYPVLEGEPIVIARCMTLGEFMAFLLLDELPHSQCHERPVAEGVWFKKHLFAKKMPALKAYTSNMEVLGDIGSRYVSLGAKLVIAVCGLGTAAIDLVFRSFF
jgi:hypothetical protein